MINCAKVAKEADVPRMLYVSSQGAKATSWIHYLKVKGQVNCGKLGNNIYSLIS